MYVVMMNALVMEATYSLPCAAVLTIVQSFPCRALESAEKNVSVEMEPTSQIETCERITSTLHNDGFLRVVGWYHSHPVFEPDPSLRDIENQINYQTLFRGNGADHEAMPFLGAIISRFLSLCHFVIALRAAARSLRSAAAVV